MKNISIDNEVLVAVDFDGTITTEDTIINTNPQINPTAVKAILRMQELGATIILWTCRYDESLKEALRLSKAYGLHFDLINDGNGKRTKSRKVNADLYIDDKATLGPIDWDAYVRKVEKLIERRKKCQELELTTG